MIFGKQKNPSIIVLALFWRCLTLVCQADDAIPVHTIIEQFPRNINLNLQENILAYATGNKIYVYDLVSGEQLWWKPSNQKGEYYNTAIGNDYIVMFSEETYIVLDKTTGNELWREAMGDWQHIEWAWFEPDSNLLRMRCEGSQVLYNLDTRQGYRIPFEKYSQYSGLMPDGASFYVFNDKGEDPPPSHLDAQVWQPGERQPTKRFSLESPGELIVRGVADNVFLVSDFLYKRTPEHILRTYDINTGEMIQEFSSDLANSMSQYYCWAICSKGCFLWLDEEQKHLYQLDAATGESTIVAIPDNFKVFYGGTNSTITDTAGNWWYLAQDEAFNICLLPFNHEDAPRKLVDGSRFLPATYCTLSTPYLIARNYYGKDYVMDICRLRDMQKLAKWHGYIWDTAQLTSTDLKYGVTTFPKREGLMRADTAYVCSQEQEAPLFTVKGSPSIISPDGQLVVIIENDGYYSYNPGTTQEDYQEYRKNNPEKNAVHIIDVHTQKVVARYDAKYAHAVTAFSKDSRYLALYSNAELKVVDTLQEFHEIPLFVPGRKEFPVYKMEFSTDGQRLLISGYGEAFLFDVAAGKHSLTLTEKARFKSRYGAGSGSSILGKLEAKAKEFIGRYTDRFKNKPELKAKFSEDETQIITVAQDMLIRFWDARTGRMIRTLDPQLPEKRNQWGRIGNTIILSDNGAYALTYNQDGFDTGTLWDMETSTKIRCYTFLGADRVEAALSENGDRVYAMINSDLYFLDGAPEKKQ